MECIFMAQSHVLSALIGKRSELMGLIDVKRKELEQLNQGLLSIDGTIKLFDPDFNLLSVKSKRHYAVDDVFGRGELSRLALEMLRGRSLTIDQLMTGIKSPKPLGDEQAKDAEVKLKVILSKQKRRGLLVVNDGIWSVV
jgi:hypothetical protein